MSKALLEAIRTARERRDCAALADAIPYARFLGIAADSSTGELLCRMQYSDMLVGNKHVPALHGGTLGALLETTAIFQLLWEADTDQVPKIINITVDYLRSGRPVDTFAHATLTKLGRRVASVRVLAWQTNRDKPIATANAHFLLKPAPR